MVRMIETIIRNTEFRLFLFSSLNQSKDKIKAKFTRVKSAFLISSTKILANFSIPKPYPKLLQLFRTGWTTLNQGGSR